MATDSNIPQLHRRALLAGTSLLLTPRTIFAGLAIDDLNPFGHPDQGYHAIRSSFNTPADIERAARTAWDQFAATSDFQYGHWGLLYTYLWWQSLPVGQPRIKTAIIGRKMADKLAAFRPDHPAGHMWGANFFGFEALSRGILNSLQMVPELLRRLDRAEQVDPTYLDGLVYLARAKLYIKLPGFPMSVGSLDKGYKYLEQARSMQESRYALWYVVLAEAEFERRGRDAALAALDGIDNVCPYDRQTRYTYELSKYLAGKFVAAIQDGSYDRYTWDPLLEPVLELQQREFVPGQLCPAE